MNHWTACLLQVALPWADRQGGQLAWMTQDGEMYHLDAFQACDHTLRKGRKFFRISIRSQLFEVTNLSLHFSYTSFTWKYRHLMLQPHVFCHLYGLETGSLPSFFTYSFLAKLHRTSSFSGTEEISIPYLPLFLGHHHEGKLMVFKYFQRESEGQPGMDLSSWHRLPIRQICFFWFLRSPVKKVSMRWGLLEAERGAQSRKEKERRKECKLPHKGMRMSVLMSK